MARRTCAACGKPLARGARRWHWRCVPRSFYRDNLQRSNWVAVARRRRQKFAADLDRLTTERGTLTREDLLYFGAMVLDRGWHMGYGACEAKWRRRMKEKAAA